MRLPVLSLVPAALLLAGPGPRIQVGSAPVVDVVQVKARLLERMLGYVTWPRRVDPLPRGAFRVGFYGRTPVAREFAKLVQSRTFLGRPIEVGYITSKDSLESYDLVFVSEGEARRAGEIAARLAGKPVFTVCDGRDGGAKGIILSMFVVDEKAAYDVNLGRARLAGFAIHSQVLHYAAKVLDGGTP